MIDVYEFDWNSIRNHSDCQVDATQALCLTHYTTDNGKSYVLAGTRQGCIDVYDTKQWTIFQSHRLPGSSPITNILCNSFQIPGGQLSPGQRRNSLPSAFMKKGNSVVIVSTMEGKVFWMNSNRLLENANPEWTNVNFQPKSGKILKILISNENIYILSRNCLFLFVQKMENIEKYNSKVINDEKYIDIQVAIQIFALKSSRIHIGIYNILVPEVLGLF